MTEHVLVNVRDRVCEIQLFRPEKKNAITQAMYDAMASSIDNAELDRQVRAIMLRGTDNCFTSGNDIDDFLAISAAEGGTEAAPIQRFMAALASAKKPLIAVVNGLAVGIGTTLLLHCDLVYAGISTRFQLPFTRLGLCPEFGSSYLLPALIGRTQASELLLLGEMFSAEKACKLGIINGVFPDAEVYGEACYRAQKLVNQAPGALRYSKALIKQNFTAAIEQAMRRESEDFFTLLKKPEAKEALGAFLEKRQPDFSGFD